MSGAYIKTEEFDKPLCNQLEQLKIKVIVLLNEYPYLLNIYYYFHRGKETASSSRGSRKRKSAPGKETEENGQQAKER